MQSIDDVTEEEAWKLYEASPVKSRSKLLKHNLALYALLSAKGLIDKLPTIEPPKEKEKPVPVKHQKHICSLIEYEHNPETYGLPKQMLKIKSPELYERLKSSGHIRYVPSAKELISNPEQYREKYYPGIELETLKQKNELLYEMLTDDKIYYFCSNFGSA